MILLQKEGPLLGTMPLEKALSGPQKRSGFRTLFFSSHSIGEHFVLASGMQDNVWIVGVRPCSGIQLLERVPELGLYPI